MAIDGITDITKPHYFVIDHDVFTAGLITRVHLRSIVPTTERSLSGILQGQKNGRISLFVRSPFRSWMARHFRAIWPKSNSSAAMALTQVLGQRPSPAAAHIHIAFGVDSNYVPSMDACRRSMIENNENIGIQFHFITTSPPQSDIETLAAFSEQKHSNQKKAA